MKKIIIAACLMFSGAAFVNAQDKAKDQDQSTVPAQTLPTQQQPAEDQDRQEVAISELPDAITASLESQDYSGWTIGTAYKKSDASHNNMEMYVVELKRGTEIKKVKFDKDGNKIDDAKVKDDQK